MVPALTFASGHVQWIHAYDPAAGELPEGIAIDKTGNIFVSLATSQIRKIDPYGNESLYHQFEPPGSPVGLAVDAPGNLYAGVFIAPPGDPAGLIKGVWRISPTGEAVHLPGTEGIGLPNALAFDKRGNLYVTDTNVFGTDPPQGAIWRIPPNGAAEVWFQDSELLGGLGELPGYFPLGANGIAYHDHGLYVFNTEKGLISHVPVLPDGSPGTPTIIADDPVELWLLDGIAMDVHGMIYAAMVGQNRILKVDPKSGEITEVAGAGDGLDGPASLAFGTGRGDRGSLFFTNYAVLSAEPNPGVLKVDVGVPGLPLP
jgi:sugar lactone lactonase YvrE